MTGIDVAWDGKDERDFLERLAAWLSLRDKHYGNDGNLGNGVFGAGEGDVKKEL